MHSTHDIIDEKTIKIKNLHVMFRSFRGDMNNVWVHLQLFIELNYSENALS